MEDSVHKHRISFGVFTPSLINTFCVTSAGERNCIFFYNPILRIFQIIIGIIKLYLLAVFNNLFIDVAKPSKAIQACQIFIHLKNFELWP